MCIKYVYDEELAQVIWKAKKSRGLQLPVWRPRRASGESSNPNAGRLKNQEEPVFSLSPKAGKDQYPSSAGSQEGPLFTSGRVSLFVPFRHSTDGVRPTTLGRAICFSQSTHSNVHLLQKHPHRHTQNVWAPPCPSQVDT